MVVYIMISTRFLDRYQTGPEGLWGDLGIHLHHEHVETPNDHFSVLRVRGFIVVGINRS